MYTVLYYAGITISMVESAMDVNEGDLTVDVIIQQDGSSTSPVEVICYTVGGRVTITVTVYY